MLVTKNRNKRANGFGIGKARHPSKELSEKNKLMHDRGISPAQTKFGELPASSMWKWCVEAEGHRLQMSASKKDVELIVHIYAGRKF